MPEQTTVEALELHAVQQQPTPEQQTDPAYVESFVDGRGIERKAEYPKVMLDAEAREAIETYYVEHDTYADTIEHTMERVQEMRETCGDYGGNVRPFEVVTSKVALGEKVKEAQKSADIAESINGPDNDAPKHENLAAIIAKTEAGKAVVEAIPEPLRGTSLKEIKSYLDTLPESIRTAVGEVEVTGIKARLSGAHRAEIVERIDQAVSRARSEARQAADHGSEIREEVQTIFVEALATSLQEQPPFYSGDAQLAHAGRERELSSEDFGSTLLHRNDIGDENSPTQNQEVLEEINGHVDVILGAVGHVRGVEEKALAALTDPEVLKAITLLSDTEQSLLMDNLAMQARKVLHGAEAEPFITGVARALERVHYVDQAAEYRLVSALGTVYQEQALPLLYASDREKTRFHELVAKFRSFSRKPHEFNEVMEAQAFKPKDIPIKSAGQVVCHATGFAEEIIAAGSIMSKQRQIDKLGTLHEQMRESLYTDGELRTHSSMPHFSEGYVMSYAQSRANGEGLQGVFVMPLAEIVAQAPYDSNGKLLKVLPRSPSSRAADFTPSAPRPSSSMHDDLVFHASPEFETSDDVEFPIDHAGVVLITPKDGRDIQLPETIADRARIVTPVDRTMPAIPEVGSAIVELQRKIAAEHQDELVVPLRVAGLNYEPERPTGVIGQSTRFRRFSSDRVLQVGEKPLKRKHTSDRVT